MDVFKLRDDLIDAYRQYATSFMRIRDQRIRIRETPALDPQSAMVVRGLAVAPVLELAYTAWDIAGFAADLGYDGPPFRWDEERRTLLRAELDAMAEAEAAGWPYETVLDPPPADPSLAHPESTRPEWARRPIAGSGEARP